MGYSKVFDNSQYAYVFSDLKLVFFYKALKMSNHINYWMTKQANNRGINFTH